MATDVASLQPATTETAYSLGEFSDDQRRLLGLVHPFAPGPLEPLEDLETRWYPVHVHALRHALLSGDPTALFFEKYGYEKGAARMRLFSAIVEFLHDRREGVTEAGLARENEPLLVDEEFLRYVLDLPRSRGDGAIPGYAVIEFLDALGHRRR